MEEIKKNIVKEKEFLQTCDLDKGICSSQFGHGVFIGCSDKNECKHKIIRGESCK